MDDGSRCGEVLGSAMMLGNKCRGSGTGTRKIGTGTRQIGTGTPKQEFNNGQVVLVPVDHYPIHGPARLPFKWKENVKRKCGLIFEFWKIRPKEERFCFGVATYFYFYFIKGKPSKNKKPP